MPLSKNSDLAFFVNRVIDWSSSNSTSLPALLLSGSIKQGAIPAFRSSPRFLVQPSPPAQKQIEKEIKPPIEYQVDSLFIYFSLSLDILHSRSVPMSKSRMCLEQDWWAGLVTCPCPCGQSNVQMPLVPSAVTTRMSKAHFLCGDSAGSESISEQS